MSSVNPRDNQILFWLVVIGILFYFYIDIRMNKFKEEMKWHLMYMEQIYKLHMATKDDPTLLQSKTTRESFAPIQQPTQWNDKRIQFINDNVPSKEEMKNVLWKTKSTTKNHELRQNKTNEGDFNVQPWTSGAFGFNDSYAPICKETLI